EEHNTLSILKTIEERYDLRPLNALDAKASSLTNGLHPRANPSLGVTYLERDGENPGKSVLIVLGTQAHDEIAINNTALGVRVRSNSHEADVDQTFTSPLSRIEVYAQGGGDRIDIGEDVTAPALVFGGAGPDWIHAGGGPSVIVGGAGRDELTGGNGAAILIGGAAAGTIKSGAGPRPHISRR